MDTTSGQIALKARLAHYWWGMGLFATFFVTPLAALWAWGRFVSLGLGLPLWFLITTALTAVLLLLFMPSWRWYRKAAYERIINDTVNDIPPSELKNIPWKQRWSSFLVAITRLEFFGWIIWITALLAGITGAFKNFRVANQTSLWEMYLSIINTAAGDLILASIIGSIVLFFIKLLDTYQGAILKAKETAEAAQGAAEGATQAITEAGKIVPSLQIQVKKTLDIFHITSNVLKVDTLSSKLASSLQHIADDNTALAQVRELSTMMAIRIDQILQEITHTYHHGAGPGERDNFDLVSLAALYTTYLKVETLSFDGDQKDVGRRGCRLSTRYPHYALTVRSVVEALHALDSDRYVYYTIFNRPPVNFFNPERPDVRNPIANMTWTALFLEKFCRWHHQDNIRYNRYFVTVDEHTVHGKVPPMDLVARDELNEFFILCNIKRGVPRPILWGEAARVLLEPEMWTELAPEDANAMAEIARDILPAEHVERMLTSVEMMKSLANPSYVILDRDEKEKVEEAIKDSLFEIQFKPVRDILLTYHSPSTPPQILKFDTFSQYQEFFGQQIPRDLLGVWDQVTKKWCLCIGSMVGESDPTAVEMIYMTEKRNLRHLPWELLTEKLSKLFLIDEEGITREQL